MKSPKTYFEKDCINGKQYQIKDKFVSFNPDDDRFYVCQNINGTNVRATFKRFSNAINYAKNN